MIYVPLLGNVTYATEIEYLMRQLNFLNKAGEARAQHSSTLTPAVDKELHSFVLLPPPSFHS